MRIAAAGLLLLLAAPALAQDDIVVTGRGLTDAAGDEAYSIADIDRDRLNTTASGRIEDALRDVAGLAQFRRSDARSANPTSQGITLRGLGGNAAARALVLLDGVPQGDPFAGYVNWPLYLPERIGRVRVTRGGGSGAGGAGALAGTIEIDSVGAPDALGLTAPVAGGSYGAIEGRATLAGKLGSGFALVSGGYARGDGFVPVVTAGPADQPARYDQGSLAARAVVPAGSGELQASIDAFDDIRTRGTGFSRNRTTGADANLRYVAPRFSLLGYLQIRRFASQFASVDVSRTVTTQTLDQYNTPATGAGLKVEWRPAVGLTETRIGAEWRRTSGETNELFSYAAGLPTRVRKAGGRSDIAGLFAEATQRVGALTLTFGGRADGWWLTGGRATERRVTGDPLTDIVYPDRSGWEWTGRAGAALALSPALRLRAAAYAGWRLPTLNELYRPFRVGIEATAANAALDPERSTGAEIGADWQSGRLNASLTAFSMRLSGAIANVTVSTSPTLIQRERRNLDAVMSNGVEADLAWRSGAWRLAGSLSYTDARVRASGTAAGLDTLRPASVAPFQASATLGWRGLSATMRYSAAQFDDDQNTRRLAPALTLDAVAAIPIGHGIALVARVENAFDTQVEAARSAAGVLERASPRAIWLGVRYER